jgi:hypothetical protein
MRYKVLIIFFSVSKLLGSIFADQEIEAQKHGHQQWKKRGKLGRDGEAERGICRERGKIL